MERLRQISQYLRRLESWLEEIPSRQLYHMLSKKQRESYLNNSARKNDDTIES